MYTEGVEAKGCKKWRSVLRHESSKREAMHTGMTQTKRREAMYGCRNGAMRREKKRSCEAKNTVGRNGVGRKEVNCCRGHKLKKEQYRGMESGEDPKPKPMFCERCDP